jgi:endonuclease/exonuclease/phosphatase family metal-dependent hydrolase
MSPLIQALAALAMLAGCSQHGASSLTVVPADTEGEEGSDAAELPDLDATADAASPPVALRVATFNTSLFRGSAGQLARDLAGGNDAQARAVAETLQRVRPDIVLLNEFDWDAEGLAARAFAEDYLAVSQNGAEPLAFGHRYVPATNTGIHSGIDLNRDGVVNTTPGSADYGNDALGYGLFPGQYGMVVFSQYPIALGQVRTFQTLRWAELPQNLQPVDWYGAEAVALMRLSSKNHADLPIEVNGRLLHLLVSHPTPPSFDGAEDRNGRRNHDEIRFWSDYLDGGDAVAAWLRDDNDLRGGLDPAAPFVILGDLNSDPVDGGSRHEALVSLLAHPRLQDPRPESDGGAFAAGADGRANAAHRGDPRQDTADFSDGSVGNLRVDYALPSANLTLRASGVFWPAPGEASDELAGVSDHHLVWVDVTLGAEE